MPPSDAPAASSAELARPAHAVNAYAAVHDAYLRAQGTADLLGVALVYQPDDVLVGMLAVASPDTPTPADALAQARAFAGALRATFGANATDRSADALLARWLLARQGTLGWNTPLEAIVMGEADAVRTLVREIAGAALA